MWNFVGTDSIAFFLIIFFVNNTAHLKFLGERGGILYEIGFRIYHSYFFIEGSVTFFRDLFRTLYFLFFSFDIIEKLLDLSIIIWGEIHDILKGFVKIGFNFKILFGPFNDKIVDPVLKINVDSVHIFI